ncbi:MAG: carbohydrate ABC transporter permease [Actinomycetota bacterium]
MDDHNKQSPLGSIAFFIGMLLFLIFTLFPLYWVFRMSAVPAEELFKSPSLGTIFSIPFDLEGKCDLFGWQFTCPTSYETVLADQLYKDGLLNSLIIASITTLVCLTVGSVAAYALARIDFFAKKPVLSTVLAISFFPAVAIIAPLFIQFQAFGLLNTYWSAIIPDIMFALPLTIYLLVAYFRQLPADLEDAAKVDGASMWQAFIRVTVPLSAPGVVTTGILTFIFAWNEFLFANTFLLEPKVQPATVIIPQFASIYTTDYGAQAAAALLMTVPLVIMVLFFQRRIVAGLTAGAVK